MQDIERPTATLNGDLRHGTIPARDLDPLVAMERAIAMTGHCYAGEDVSILQKAMMTYLGATMSDAVSEMAWRRHEAGPGLFLATADGWQAHANESRPGTLAMLLVHPAKSGGWHVDCKFVREMTEAAKDRIRAIEADLEKAGVSPIEMIMASLGLGRKDVPGLAEISAINKASESWRAVKRGDRIDKIVVSAVDLGPASKIGIGPGGRPKDVNSVTRLETILKAGPDDFVEGKHLTLRPLPTYQKKMEFLHSVIEHQGGCAHIAARLLSDLVRADGLASRVKAESDRIGALSWDTYPDIGNHTELEEAGYAVICSSDGLFDDKALRHLADFSARIAAHDMQVHLGEILQMAHAMLKTGITTEDAAFDCNDLRDVAYVLREDRDTGGCLQILNKTQNGSFRTDLIDVDGQIAEIICNRVGGGVVGRFAVEDGVVRPNYGDEIDYTIRNIQDMNGIILSLSSVSCCFSEEMDREIDDGESPQV